MVLSFPLILALGATQQVDWARTHADGFETCAAAGERVTMQSPGQSLEAWVWRSRCGGPQRAAVVMLHGCSGVYGSNGYGDEGSLSSHLRATAQRFAVAGLDVVLVDSFSTRDPAAAPPHARQNYCGDRPALLAIGATEERHRPFDALAARDYLLSGSSGIDPAKVFLLGYSQGGSAALAAMDARVLPAGTFVGAAIYYPGCGMYGAFGGGQIASTYAATGPVTIHVGSEDLITDLAWCDRHARSSAGAGAAPVSIHTWPDAHHNFDSAHCVESAEGTTVSHATGRRYACKGSHDGIALTLDDWRARLNSARLVDCDLSAAASGTKLRCSPDEIVP